jgi:anti-sigma factor RsiW
MPHPDEGLIHAWLDGELDATEAARVEALVTTDPEWAAAAAEARGLIAATTRITAALDRVPANVIPAAAPVRRRSRQWTWRAAAAIVLLAGSAVVFERRGAELPVRAASDQSSRETAPPPAAGAPGGLRHVPAPAPAPALGAARADSIAKVKSSPSLKELDTKKPAYLAGANDAASAQGAVPAGMAGASIAPRPLAPRALAERATRPQFQCFEQRQPPDSAKRVITLDARALADSVRLGTLTIHGDTLAAANGRLTAVRVQCPER